MPLLNEQPRISDVVLMEEGESVLYTRDNITVLSGTPPAVVGTVLGAIALGVATSAVKASGANTGTGTLVLDAVTPILANAKPGLYTVRVTAVGVAVVTDPTGVVLGEIDYLPTTAVNFADRLKFVFTDSATHYVVGDGFDITVAAGSTKFVPIGPAALDGSQNAGGVLLTPIPVALVCAALTRGPAVVKLNGLIWPAGMSAGAKTAAMAQLTASASL
ncbi:MAG: head decoration protein [Ignavibacteriota bacterium]